MCENAATSADLWKVGAFVAKTIAIVNQKGGVGKTTTCVNLAAALSEAGQRVLLCDFDPQANSTSGMGVDKTLSRGIYQVLIGESPAEDTVVHTRFGDVLPSNKSLAGAGIELITMDRREFLLQDALNQIADRYDYIFIDCPPSLGLLTVNALVAADKLLIPIQCEFYALEGVTKLLDSMKRVKTRLNPSLDIFGVLLTMYDGRTTLSRQVVDEVRSYFGKTVFTTMIPRTVKLSEAPSFGQPITQYDPTGKGAKTYVDLAKEVIQRG
mgnify:CR=1 FL=1